MIIATKTSVLYSSFLFKNGMILLINNNRLFISISYGHLFLHSYGIPVRYCYNYQYVENMLATQFDTYQKFENYFITDSNGMIVLDAVGGAAIGLDITGYPFWRLSTENLEYHIDDFAYRSPVTDKLVIVMATRIEDNTG